MLKTLFVALALAVAGAAPAAHAFDKNAPDANVEVIVIHAKHDGPAIGPDLQPLERYLVKSFPQYKSFKRLDGQTQRLAVGASGRLGLPNGSELVYRHEGVVDGGFVALHLEVGGLKTTVNVKDGGTFFQAGRGYDGGMIILAFKVASAR